MKGTRLDNERLRNIILSDQPERDMDTIALWQTETTFPLLQQVLHQWDYVIAGSKPFIDTDLYHEAVNYLKRQPDSAYYAEGGTVGSVREFFKTHANLLSEEARTYLEQEILADPALDTFDSQDENYQLVHGAINELSEAAKAQIEYHAPVDLDKPEVTEKTAEPEPEPAQEESERATLQQELTGLQTALEFAEGTEADEIKELIAGIEVAMEFLPEEKAQGGAMRSQHTILNELVWNKNEDGELISEYKNIKFTISQDEGKGLRKEYRLAVYNTKTGKHQTDNQIYASIDDAKYGAASWTAIQEGVFKYAQGGFVGKGELVWNKVDAGVKLDFLIKNFTPEITPRTQEDISKRAYNFVPKNVKIKWEAEYANKDAGEYAKGGGLGEDILNFDDYQVKIRYNQKFKRWEGLHRAINPKTKQPLQKWGFDRDSEVADSKEELLRKYKNINSNSGPQKDLLMYVTGTAQDIKQFAKDFKAFAPDDDIEFLSDLAIQIDAKEVDKDVFEQIAKNHNLSVTSNTYAKGGQLKRSDFTLGEAQRLIAVAEAGQPEKAIAEIEEYIAVYENSEDKGPRFGRPLQSIIEEYKKAIAYIRQNTGKIKNQYAGKTAEQVWDSWTPAQRSHFIDDHDLNENVTDKTLKQTAAQLKAENFGDAFGNATKWGWIENLLIEHVIRGQYAKGGKFVSGKIIDATYRDGDNYKYQVRFDLPENFKYKVGDDVDVSELGLLKKQWKNIVEDLTGTNWNGNRDHYIIEVDAIRDKEPTDTTVLDWNFAKGGHPARNLSRDRMFRSQQEWEKNLKRKTKAKKYKRALEHGGEAGEEKYYTVSLYFKDDPEEIIDGYTIKDGSLVEGEDDDIFLYATEADIKEMMKPDNDDYDFVVTKYELDDSSFARGGHPARNLSRDRMFRSQQEWEKNLNRKTPAKHYKEDGGTMNDVSDGPNLTAAEKKDVKARFEKWRKHEPEITLEDLHDGHVEKYIEDVLSSKYLHKKDAIRSFLMEEYELDDSSFARGGHPARNLSRDRMFRSQQEWEKNLNRKTPAKRYKKAAGGKAGRGKKHDYTVSPGKSFDLCISRALATDLLKHAPENITGECFIMCAEAAAEGKKWAKVDKKMLVQGQLPPKYKTFELWISGDITRDQLQQALTEFKP